MTRKTYQCRTCGQPGHNSRTCGRKPGAEAKKKPPTPYGEALEARHPGITDLLGEVPDSEVAAKYGVSRQAIQQFRARLGVPSHRKQYVGSPRDLTEDEIALLGMMPDKELAEIADLPVYRVARERQDRGVPAFSPLDVLDDVLAPVKDRLGKVSDRQLARELDGKVTRGQIGRYRKARGIETEIISPRCEGFEPIDREAIRRLFHEGKSDVEIAEAVGSTRATVALIRTEELRLLRHRSPRYKRGKHHPARVSDEGRAEIRRLYAETGNALGVSRQVGRSYACVLRILKRGIGFPRPPASGKSAQEDDHEFPA